MIQIKITRSAISALGKNGIRQVGREAIGAAALYWWENYLPLHFQNIAYRRYGYQPRVGSTNRAKERRYKGPDGLRAIGEVNPLVFTGRSRTAALEAPKIKAIAPNMLQSYATVTINAPAFNFGRGKRIDMRDEVTRVNAQETKTLNDVYVRKWNERLRAAGIGHIRTKRIAA